MDSVIELTVGQLIGFIFAILGMIAAVVLIILLIHLIQLVKEAKAVGREVREVLDDTREKVDNIFGVAGKIGDAFGKVTAGLDLVSKIERFTSKGKSKKNKKQGED